MQTVRTRFFNIILSLLPLLISFLFVGCASAGGYSIAPKPEWVNRITPSASQPIDDSKAGKNVAYVLVDYQYNMTGNESERYYHYIDKAINISGVEEISQLTIDFDPSYETLILHEIVVHRKNTIIDRLPRSQLHLIQREKELEYSIYDGSKTLSAIIEDVRVGDSIEYSFTIKGMNPVFSGHFSTQLDFGWSVPVQNLHYRLLWPDDKPLFLKNHRTNIQPDQHVYNGTCEYAWKANNTPVTDTEDDMPGWYLPYPQVYLSDYANWGEVVNWAIPLYRVTEKGNSLSALVHSIQNETKDPEKQILSALKIVQEQVRYLGIEMGPRSHKPSSPGVVWQQRLGDCKDKSRLFVELLKGMGIKAVPALVNTKKGQGLKEQLPTPRAFNHVITAVFLDGKRYWLDPTRKYQKGTLQNIYQPDYGYALLVTEGTKSLTEMFRDTRNSHKKIVEEVFSITDAIDNPALYSITTHHQNYYADNMRENLAESGVDELQKSYLKYTANYYPDIEIAEKLTIADDAENNIVTTKEKYTIHGIWQETEDKNFVALYFEPFLISDHIEDVDSPLRTVPYEIPHPVSYRHTTKIKGMTDAAIANEKKEIADKAFNFTSKVDFSGDIVTLEYFYESLSDHVDPEDFKTFSNNIQKVQDLSYYQISMPNPALNFGTYRFAFKDINWNLVSPILLTLVCLIFVAYYLVYVYEPPYTPPPVIDKNLEGLSGWLILICLGLIATPLKVLWQMKDSLHFFSTWQWAIIQDQTAEGMNILIIAEMMVNIALILFSVTLLVLFFKRRHTFPKLYIIFLIGTVSCLILDYTALSWLEGTATDNTAAESTQQLVRQVFFSLIWWAYMVKSARVKATFTRNRSNIDLADTSITNEPEPTSITVN